MQALLVSRELVRISVLWIESWVEEIDNAYQLRDNPEAAFEVLAPLYKLLDEGPVSTRDKSFTHVFGRDLNEARECFKRFKISGDFKEYDRVWELYSSVSEKIRVLLTPPLSKDALHLSSVSDVLSNMSGFELAVPGEFPT